MPKAFPMVVDPIFVAQNGFVSAVVARAGGVATALWAVGLAAINPAAGRTAATISTIYTLIIENNTGAAITAWLEVGGVVVTPIYHVNNAESSVISFIAGLNIGNQDIDCNANVNAVNFQILGLQV